MPGITRCFTDNAGGVVLGGSNSTVSVNGVPGAVITTPISGHGDGPHAAPWMAGASTSVYFSGLPVCRVGDTASCGHIATGSSDVFAG